MYEYLKKSFKKGQIVSLNLIFPGTLYPTADGQGQNAQNREQKMFHILYGNMLDYVDPESEGGFVDAKTQKANKFGKIGHPWQKG